MLNEDDRTNKIAPIFDRHWLNQLPRSERRSSENQKLVSYRNNEANIETKVVSGSKKKKPGVITTLYKTFGWYFIFGAMFKLCQDLLQFTSPQLLKALIIFISSEDEPIWHGYFIAITIFLIAIVQSLILNFYFQRMFVVGMRVRTALISAIYRKSLNLSNAARKGTTLGEIVNLMSGKKLNIYQKFSELINFLCEIVDAQRFMDLMMSINLVWSCPVQIGLAIFFLYLEMGPSVFAGLLVMILLLPLNGYLAALQRKIQTKQMKHKDERVKMMNEILNGIKVIKLYAWEYPFMEIVTNIRDKEMKKLIEMAYFGCVSTFVWTCAPFLVSLVTFAVYVLSDETHVLDAQKAFVSLALFNLLRFPMSMLPQMITFVVMVN